MKLDFLNLRLIDMTKPVTIFNAKKVVTINPDFPETEAVAVQTGLIVGLGPLNSLTALLAKNRIEVELNDSFANAVIYPGFSEHHMHPQVLGEYLNNAHYVGYVDRKAADGSLLKGIKSLEELKARLRELIEQEREQLEANPNQWLNCWGIDPLHLSGVDLTRKVLDEVSTEFPICLGHASGHVININTKGVELAGYNDLPEDPNLFRYEDGTVNGTIAEPPMMHYAFEKGALLMDFSLEGLMDATEVATKVARMNGCTSITDKGTNIPLTPGCIGSDAWIEARKQGRLYTRVILEPWCTKTDVWEYKGKQGWEAILELKTENDPMLAVGNYKLLADGSIQGFTAHLLPDQHYVTEGKPNGHLLMSIEQIHDFVKTAESYGFSCSIHTNGNGTTEAALQAIESIREQEVNPGFRHSFEHCQLATENQFYRMKKAGITPNLFPNHMYYWGDAHAKFTVGEHMTRRMNACRSATNHGLLHGVHSDDMVTEVSPLFSAWCAVNRRSMSGKVYGEDQCLTVAEAMKVITYNHAWLAHQEDVRGTLEIGKWADFTVLAEEATEDKRETLKDIAIVGTVIGGDDIFLN